MSMSFLLICIANYRLLCSKKDFFYILYLPICIFYFVLENDISHKHVIAINPNHYKVIASVTKRIIDNKGYVINCYYNEGDKIHAGKEFVSEYEYKSIGDSMKIIIVDNDQGEVTYEWNPTSLEIIKYSKPVYFRGDEELGNDYYYYAKLNPKLALQNFGLKKVFMGLDKNDSLLVYKNINDSIEFKTVHICADTLQTASNRALVGDSFAFLFQDGIYTKEQVFDEIPQAKEYYLKYFKDDNQAP